MIRETFLINRIVKEWNKMSDEVIQPRTVDEFKARYDKCINEQKATIA
jgi:hypothetical protein